jgi:hypothetical protein
MSTLHGALSKIDEKTTEKVGDHKRAIDALLACGPRLERLHSLYLRTGVAVFTSSDLEDFETRAEFKLRGFFRSVATELGRPYVSADVGHSRIELRIPKGEKCNNLAAGLMLVAKDIPGPFKDQAYHWRRWHADNDHHTVTRVDGNGSWLFFFNGEEGRKLFNQFLEQCRTDPVFKVILRNHGG